MKTLIKRMVVMSVALVLLCAFVVAQHEKSTRSGSATYNLPTLTVTPNPVELLSGDSATVTIMPDPGYYHPTIFYDGYTYEIGQTFEGEIFRVEPTGTNNPSCFKIIAKDINEESEECIYIYIY